VVLVVMVGSHGPSPHLTYLSNKGHLGPSNDGRESWALSTSHILSDKGHHSPSNDDKESEVFSRTLRMVRQGSKPLFPLVAGNYRMAKCY